MTAGRGGAVDPASKQPIDGTGPSTDQTASSGRPYRKGARWSRYHEVATAGLPPDRLLFAQLPAELVRDRTLPARAVRLWAGLYLEVFDPADGTAEGAVDVHRVCAACRISPAMARRYVGQLIEAGWILERRTIRRAGLVGLVRVRLNLARRGTSAPKPRNLEARSTCPPVAASGGHVRAWG